MARKSRKSLPFESARDRISGKSRQSCRTVPEERRTYYRAALYARISEETEVLAERESLDTQMCMLRDYVRQSDDIQIAGEYLERGYTGTCFERPAFDEMMMDIRSGKADCIVVKDLSRLGRNHVEAGDYIEKVFPFLNVRFIAITDGYDSVIGGDSAAVPVKNIINEMYAKDISRKVRSALDQKIRSGKFAGSLVPYGYLRSPDDRYQLIIFEETAAVVRRIFQMFLSGMDFSSIARALNEEGIPDPPQYRNRDGKIQDGKEREPNWSYVHVRRILVNQYYAGDSVYGKTKFSDVFGEKKTRHVTDESEWTIVPDTHPAIVDRETFEEARGRAVKRGRLHQEIYKAGTGCVHSKNLFEDKIFCAKCKKKMWLLKNQNTGVYCFYCGGYAKYGRTACYHHHISQDELSHAVLLLIRSHIRGCMDMEKVIRELNSGRSNVQEYEIYQRGIRHEESEVSRLSERKMGLYEDYVEGIITEEDYRSLKTFYSEEIKARRKKISEMEQAGDTYAKNFRTGIDWNELVKKYLNKRKLTKEMVEAFVERIEIDCEGNCEIRLLYDDVYKELLRLKEERQVKNDGQ